MKKSLTITVLAVLLGLCQLYAQQTSIADYLAECERKYGSDADLVNGEKYFYPYRQYDGDPFFFSESQAAVILIHDKEFAGQQLRYDVFNQKLILDFEDIYGASSSLVLRSEWVESFTFEKQNFVRMEGPEGESEFFQLVTGGQASIQPLAWRGDPSGLLSQANQRLPVIDRCQSRSADARGGPGPAVPPCSWITATRPTR